MTNHACPHCKDTGIEPGTIVISPGKGYGFNSLDPDPLNRGSYVPCKQCGGGVNADQTIRERNAE
jgi:hypothetical protein